MKRQLKKIPKFLNGGPSDFFMPPEISDNNPDPNDDWIRKMLEQEAVKGSGTGTGLSNWGYNAPLGFKWIKNPNDPNGKQILVDKKTNALYHNTGVFDDAPKSIDDAITRYKQEYLPLVAKYPTGVRERMGDYIYNTGRSPEDLLLYNAGKISLDDINSNKVFTNEWNQYGPDIEKTFSDPNFISNLNKNRSDVAKTTGSYPDPNDSSKSIRYTLNNPNPAYNASWKDRWSIFSDPSQQVTPPVAPPIIPGQFPALQSIAPPVLPAQQPIIPQQQLQNNQTQFNSQPFGNLDFTSNWGNANSNPQYTAPTTPQFGMQNPNDATPDQLRSIDMLGDPRVTAAMRNQWQNELNAGQTQYTNFEEYRAAKDQDVPSLGYKGLHRFTNPTTKADTAPKAPENTINNIPSPNFTYTPYAAPIAGLNAMLDFAGGLNVGQQNIKQESQNNFLSQQPQASYFNKRMLKGDKAMYAEYGGELSDTKTSFLEFMNGGLVSPKYEKGGIHINPKNKGKFTEWANAHGMGVQEAASHVMANKEDYSPITIKRANFARVFGGRHYELGGMTEDSFHIVDSKIINGKKQYLIED